MLKNEFEMEAQQLTKAEKRKRPKDKSTTRLDKNLEIRRESAAGARAPLNLSSRSVLDSAKDLVSSPELGDEDLKAEEDFSSDKREFEADLESEVEESTKDSSTAESNFFVGDAEMRRKP